MRLGTTMHRAVSVRVLMVLENLESPGILLWHFSGPESPGKGHWSWKVLNDEVYGRQ